MIKLAAMEYYRTRTCQVSAGTPFWGGKNSRRPEKQAGEDSRRRGGTGRFFRQQRGAELAKLSLSLKIHWHVPTRARTLVIWKSSLNIVRGEIKLKLLTIHPNPGPRGRDKSDEGKKARRERRYKKRIEKRTVRPKGSENDIEIITWNVQRMSLGTANKRKMRMVANYVNKNKWEIVLLSEVRAERNGVIWIGEGEEVTAVIHSEKAGIMIRGEMLKKWTEGGQQKRQTERAVGVKIEGLVLISTYLPVYNGQNMDEIENTREKIIELSEWARGQDILIIGGDFNAHVGGGEERPGICGKFGLRTSNRMGTDLLEWCEENNLVHVSSFYNHKNRGTWFSNIHRQWYEIDGFIMKREQRHKAVIKISTVGEATLSDHKPKKIKIKCKIKKWRNGENKKRIPKIKWEMLKNPEIQERYRERVTELLADHEENDEDTTNWNAIAEVVNTAAKEVCGVQEKSIENPWMLDKDEEVRILRARINGAITRRNNALQNAGNDDINENEDVAESRNELKEARKDLKRKTREWEEEWWQNILNECKEAGERGDSGRMYKTLKKLGTRDIKKETNTTNIDTSQFREHFKKVSEVRFENTPEEIEETVNRVKDLRGTDKANQWKDILESTPGREEILEQMKKMKDSSPGDDGVRLCYLMKAGPEITNKIIEMVQFMFENGADKWEESLKIGIVIPLFKKGDRNNPNNYRGVCLLAMGSRILARILADRLRRWAEMMELLDDEQSGFRTGRSTADSTQIMVRIQEDTADLRKRMEAAGEVLERDDEYVARLLDLRKAYPRVNKPALWGILERYGMGERCLRVLKDLHEATIYRVRGKEGDSEPWVPERGLREGCPSSPPLFNIYHQASMRMANEDRKVAAMNDDLTVGIEMNWVPGDAFPSEGRWEKKNSEAVTVKVSNCLFADDTSVAGKRKELERGVRITKEAMAKFEERNNEDKEEEVVFGTEESGNIRMLGTWLGPKEDVNQRLKRAGNAWRLVKNRLKKSKLTKKMQSRIVQACVESTALFDCQARSWQKGEIKRIQQFMDKSLRYIWSRKNQPPLMEMQQRGVNMQDIRNELEVKSIRVKIEKRVLERIGHVIRMDDDRLTKAVCLGWMKELESWPKVPGKKRKTVLYWRRLIKEAGLDHTRIGNLCKDRKEWKATVRERTEHLEEWEKKGGKNSTEERGERNNIRREEESLECESCGKICKSKAGLTNHRKRTHEESKNKKKFSCDTCGEVFKSEGARKNHMGACETAPTRPGFKKCISCNKEVTSSNFSRHRKTCNRGGEEIQENTIRRFKGARTICQNCNLEVSKRNLARHQDTCTGGEAVL